MAGLTQPFTLTHSHLHPKSPVNLMHVFGGMKLDYQRGTNPDLGGTD